MPPGLAARSGNSCWLPAEPPLPSTARLSGTPAVKCVSSLANVASRSLIIYAILSPPPHMALLKVDCNMVNKGKATCQTASHVSLPAVKSPRDAGGGASVCPCIALSYSSWMLIRPLADCCPGGVRASAAKSICSCRAATSSSAASCSAASRSLLRCRVWHV